MAAGTREQRLADVLGDDFVTDSVALDHAVGPVRITGRAGIPDAARSRADWQLPVNGRYVRDKVVTHAARSAYEDLLHGHRQPVYALYIEIDPTRVDVNASHQDRGALPRRPRSAPGRAACGRSRAVGAALGRGRRALARACA